MEDKEITFYESEFYMFSNFSAFNVYYNKSIWMTAEHAYQASKFTDPNLQDLIKSQGSAHAAKKAARFLEKTPSYVRSDWSEVKDIVMKEICKAKLYQHSYVYKKLIESKNAILIEDSPKDEYWGIGKNKNGLNKLGKIWMELREEIIKERKATEFFKLSLEVEEKEKMRYEYMLS